MPEACEVCAGRGENCPVCNPPTVQPPEPVKPGCQQCRVKDGQIDSLLGIVERMVGPAPVEQTAQDPVCDECGDHVHPMHLVAGHSTGQRVCTTCFAAAQSEMDAAEDPLTEAQRNPDLANTIALIEVAVERWQHCGRADHADRMNDIIDAVDSLRMDFEDGAAERVRRLDRAAQAEALLASAEAASEPEQCERICSECREQLSPDDCLTATLVARGGYFCGTCHDAAQSERDAADTPDYGRRVMQVETASQTEITREDGGLFLTPEGDPNPRIEYVPPDGAEAMTDGDKEGQASE